MPNVWGENGNIYVEIPLLAPGQPVPGGYTFGFQGWVYVYTRNGWYGYPGNAPWDMRPVHNIVVIGLRYLSLPLAEDIELQPYYVWPRPEASAGIIPSYHLDCRRLVQVVWYHDGPEDYVEIPLLDGDDQPWLSIANPPTLMVRRSSSGNVDYIQSGVTAGVWRDSTCFMLPSGTQAIGSTSTTDRSFGDQNIVSVQLVPKLDPVPHWVLRISYMATSSSANFCVMVHLLGEGYGSHAAATREEGSDGVTGHWEARLVWPGVDFNSTPTAADFNDRAYARGAIDVANSLPEASSTPGSLYLTTGASAGTSAGTNFFDVAGPDAPMVMVLGHADLGASLTLSNTASWKPESWGMGCAFTSSPCEQQSATEKDYKTELYVSSSKWLVDVYNVGDKDTDVSNSSWDRTYFAFCAGLSA